MAGFSYTPTDSIVPSSTTYAWAAPTVVQALTGGVSGTGQSTLNGILTNTTTDAVTATYSVMPSSGSCTGTAFAVTVTVNPAAIITAQSTSTCTTVGFSYTPTGTIPTGTTYAWSTPTLATDLSATVGAQTGQTVVNDNLTNTTANPATAVYSVTPTSGSCTGVVFTVSVVVNPVATIVSQTTSSCSMAGFSYSPTGVIPAVTTYAWSSLVLAADLSGTTGAQTAQSAVNDNLTNAITIAETATYRCDTDIAD